MKVFLIWKRFFSIKQWFGFCALLYSEGLQYGNKYYFSQQFVAEGTSENPVLVILTDVMIFGSLRKSKRQQKLTSTVKSRSVRETFTPDVFRLPCHEIVKQYELSPSACKSKRHTLEWILCEAMSLKNDMHDRFPNVKLSQQIVCLSHLAHEMSEMSRKFGTRFLQVLLGFRLHIRYRWSENINRHKCVGKKTSIMNSAGTLENQNSTGTVGLKRQKNANRI